MSPNPRHPSYNLEPIQSLASLAAALGLSEADLLDLAPRAPNLYREGTRPKTGGGVRTYYDALEPLKTVHGRILRQILDRVAWPRYLFGGIRDPVCPRDYVRNATFHAGAALQFTTDIKNFFPSIQAPAVQRIWQGVFHFAPPVAEMLTVLTTYRGFLPQGTRTAQALANLVLWDIEPQTVDWLEDLGFRYSRLTDDITISTLDSRHAARLPAAIQIIHEMLRARGFRRNGRKERVTTQRGSMIVNNVVTNRRVALPRGSRDDIAREAIALAKRLHDSEPGAEAALPHVVGCLHTLRRFHPREADRLGKLLWRVLPEPVAASAGLRRWA
jgi:hypothetical protein